VTTQPEPSSRWDPIDSVLERITIARIGAVLSSGFAFGAGIYLLQAEDGTGGFLDGSWGIPLGLYLIAKGFYLGPSLWAQDESRRQLERLVAAAEEADERAVRQEIVSG
jgi:hypothetical protein